MNVKPIGYLTGESINRLSSGGNDSRGTVPLHCDKSSVAKNPVYSEDTVKALSREIIRLRVIEGRMDAIREVLGPTKK